VDLRALMTKAAEMVALAERYRAALAAQAQARPHQARTGRCDTVFCCLRFRC